MFLKFKLMLCSFLIITGTGITQTAVARIFYSTNSTCMAEVTSPIATTTGATITLSVCIEDSALDGMDNVCMVDSSFTFGANEVEITSGTVTTPFDFLPTGTGIFPMVVPDSIGGWVDDTLAPNSGPNSPIEITAATEVSNLTFTVLATNPGTYVLGETQYTGTPVDLATDACDIFGGSAGSIATSPPVGLAITLAAAPTDIESVPVMNIWFLISSIVFVSIMTMFSGRKYR